MKKSEAGAYCTSNARTPAYPPGAPYGLRVQKGPPEGRSPIFWRVQTAILGRTTEFVGGYKPHLRPRSYPGPGTNPRRRWASTRAPIPRKVELATFGCNVHPDRRFRRRPAPQFLLLIGRWGNTSYPHLGSTRRMDDNASLSLVSNADPIMGRWSFPYIHSQAEETVNEMIDGIIVFSAGLAWQPGWLGV